MQYDLFSTSAIRSNQSDFTTKELTEEAIERAGEHANKEWKRKALDAVVTLCTKQREFSSDDVWVLLEDTREPRALGAIMRKAQKMGVCRAVGYAKSERRERHGGVVSVWRSCLS